MTQPPTAVTRPREKAAKKPRSVVIIDDEKIYVESMAKLIGDNLDCPVYAFTKAEDALRELRRLGAGVVVTDFLMPGMDGLEFVRKASKRAPQAAFIMISGHDLDPIGEDLATLQKLRNRMQKPFGWRPLAAAILQAWPDDDPPAVRP